MKTGKPAQNFLHGCRTALLVCFVSMALLTFGAAKVLAHDVLINIGSLSLGESYSIQHDDQDPYKGYAQVTVKNTGAQSWGDFHFQVYSQYTGPNSFWSNPEHVSFVTASPYAPTYSKGGTSIALDSYLVTPGTGPTGAMLDLYFYSHPVLSGETAIFTVYTDNTQDQKIFGLTVYPTPVPVPAALWLLGLGLVGLIGMRRFARREKNGI